jgi:hypothetical protein
MSAAPHEIGATAPALAVVPDPAPAPSLAQLMSRRTAAPEAVAQPRPQLGMPVPPRVAVRGLREPTFDELVTGHGRHRGPHQLEASGSLLRRLALRARLLPTPARRPPARATGNP